MEGVKTVYDDMIYNVIENPNIYTKEELLDAGGISEDNIIVFYSDYFGQNVYAVITDHNIDNFFTAYGLVISFTEENPLGYFSPRYVNYVQFREQVSKNQKMYWDEAREVRLFTSPFQGKIIYYLARRPDVNKYVAVVVYTQ